MRAFECRVISEFYGFYLCLWCANILPYYFDFVLWPGRSSRNTCNYKNVNRVTGILSKLLPLIALKKMVVLEKEEIYLDLIEEIFQFGVRSWKFFMIEVIWASVLKMGYYT